MPKKSRSASVGTLAELNTSTDGDDGDDNSVAGSLNLNDLDILSDDEDDILEDGEDVPPPPNSELAKALMSPPEPSPGVFKRKSASSASSTRKSRKSKLKGSKSKSLSAIDYQFKSPKGGDVSEDESITEEAESPSFSSLCSPPETPSSKSNKRRSSKKRFLGLSTALKENGDASSALPMGGEMVSSMRKTRASIINGGDSSRRSKRTVDDSSRRSKRSSSRTKTGGSEDSSRRSKRTSDKDGGSSRRSRRSSRTADSSSSTPARSSSRKKKSKKASKKDKRKSAESNASNTTSATVDMDESWASLVEKDNNTTTTTTAAPMIATKNQPLHEECQSAGVNSMFHNSINFGNFGESGRTSSDSSLDLSEDDDDDDDDNDKDNDDKKVQEKKKELPKYLGHASLTEIDFSLMNDSKDEEDEEKKEELPSIKEEVIKPPPSRRSLQRTPSSRRGLSCGPVRQRSSRGRDEDRPSSKRGFSASPERKAHTAAEAMEVERPLLSCMKGSRGKLLPTKLKHPPHVYFNETLVITPIIPTYELASKRSDLWFRQKDFDKILNRSMAIALRVKEGKKTKKCVRGLEHFLKDKEERYAAWNAVLVEQEIQHLSGNFSDVRISDLYLAASTTCRTEAFDRAKDDSDAVLEYMTE
ncbi:unnamed protein product [Cylindrotheca closterium]|uniref:Uncharacterized protein n=1 Tax=Cylindrotheca closterium TaxID=2856 RepID=A0AAD2G868_9STRA|nr:unnamed protein product [Cylindrotheca closterium]